MWVGPVIAASVSDSYELSSADLESFGLLVSSFPLALMLSASSSVGFPQLRGQRFDSAIPFRDDCSKVSV